MEVEACVICAPPLLPVTVAGELPQGRLAMSSKMSQLFRDTFWDAPGVFVEENVKVGTHLHEKDAADLENGPTCWKSHLWMSISHNRPVFYAQNLRVICKMMRLLGLFQQAGPFSR